jgi:hypothetical protein
MKKLSFSSRKFAIASIVFGVLSLASFVTAFPNGPVVHFQVIFVLAPVGFALGASSFKANTGAIGICLNVIAFLLLLSVVFFRFP